MRVFPCQLCACKTWALNCGVRDTGISDVRDESDRDGMRIVVEIKRNTSPEVMTCDIASV